MLIFARRQLEDLADAGEGWDAEYGRDVWRLHNLGFGGRQRLRFDRIPQPWLKQLVKRWARWRISTGLSWRPAAGLSGSRTVRPVPRLPAVNIAQLADVDRPVLERYLADLHAEMAGASARAVTSGC